MGALQLEYDGTVTITRFNNRKQKKGRVEDWRWSTFCDDILNRPTRTNETLAEFTAMSKPEQDDIKDVGGFVGGILKDGRRKADRLDCRTLLTLDADSASEDMLDDFTLFYGCAMLCYPTHKSRPKYPRLRLVIPLTRPVSADEYEAITRRIADTLGMRQFDKTTFEPTRLMYYPSLSKDSVYHLAKVEDAKWLDPDTILNSYHDWRNIAEWPVHPDAAKEEREERERAGRTPENPLEKNNLIGAFCRAYSIEQAIQKFIPDVYAPGESPDRYSYTHGTSSNGLVIYENGIFAYSHHGTDPASGILCNAFDLVRIHRFGHMDARTKPETDITKKPSYKAMIELASNDGSTKEALFRMREASIAEDFGAPESTKPATPESTDSEQWVRSLELKNDELVKSIENYERILRNDKRIKGVLAYNLLKDRIVAMRDLPWRKIRDPVNGDAWTDADDSSLRAILEKYSKEKSISRENIMDAITNIATRNSFHPVQDYLNGLPEWDGVERLDSLLILTLNAEDSAYVRGVTRRFFLGAMARAMKPGIKFDNALMLSGKQGRGKSSLVALMSKGWYTDSVVGIGADSNRAFESIQGAWFVELGELAALKRAEVENIKNFITKQVDSYRAAYDRRVQDRPRQCVFIGTTNKKEFLRDSTGNRRFWPIRLMEEEPVIPARDILTPDFVDQVWAETKVAYEAGESFLLTPELQKEAEVQQEMALEKDPRIGLIEEYLDTLLPEGWNDWPADKRQKWFGENADMREEGKEPRQTVCALEVWTECFQQDRSRIASLEGKTMLPLLRSIVEAQGWTEDKGRQKCGPYGTQTRFRRSSVWKNLPVPKEEDPPEQAPDELPF